MYATFGQCPKVSSFFLGMNSLTFQSIGPVANAFYKSKCPSVCFSVCLFVRLLTFNVLFKRRFPPFPNFLRFGIIGENNRKNWSMIEKLLLIKGLKSARKKKIVFWVILPYWAGFFGIGVSHYFKRYFCPHLISNEMKWFQIWQLLLLKGVKSPRQKKFFTDFFSCSLHLNVLLPHFPKSNVKTF